MQEEIKNQETVDNTASEETNKKDKKKNKKADDLAVLQNRAAAHECVNIGPTHFLWWLLLISHQTQRNRTE